MRIEAIAASPDITWQELAPQPTATPGLRVVARDHLSPHFRSASVESEIRLGTIERPDSNQWAHAVLHDAPARQDVAGVGYQWAGKAVKG